jgi:hypothetical protein
MQENYIQITTNQNENITNADIRREKIITKKGLIITSILLIFVSIFLDLYFIYLTNLEVYMKVLLCIIHPTVLVIFSFLPSGLFVEFNYNNNQFIYHKTSIIPYIWNKCTKHVIDINTIQKFKIETIFILSFYSYELNGSKFLCFRNFSLFYEDKNGNSIKITSGRDRNCVSEFSQSVLDIPRKLDCWLENKDF